MDEIMAYTDQTDIDFFDELQAIYTENRQIVQKEIYAFYAQYAKENKISVQEAKKRLMREDLSNYRANAEKYFKQAEKDPELLKRLNEQYKAGKVTRLEALQLNLEWQLGKMSGALHQSFVRYLKEVAQYAYRKITGGNSQSTLNASLRTNRKNTIQWEKLFRQYLGKHRYSCKRFEKSSNPRIYTRFWSSGYGS